MILCGLNVLLELLIDQSSNCLATYPTNGPRRSINAWPAWMRVLMWRWQASRQEPIEPNWAWEMLNQQLDFTTWSLLPILMGSIRIFWGSRWFWSHFGWSKTVFCWPKSEKPQSVTSRAGSSTALCLVWWRVRAQKHGATIEKQGDNGIL